MENCQYQEVTIEGQGNLKKKKTLQRKFIFRQMLVCSGGWSTMFLFGMCVGAPTVYIPQIRKDTNFTSVITDDVASWLSSAYCITCLPFIIIGSMATKWFGRKIPFIFGAVDILVAFIVLYYSTSVTHIFISQVLVGVIVASQLVVVVMIFTEYNSPLYRGLFLIIKTTFFYVGIWVSNAIGTFLHWKMIPLVGIVVSVYSTLTGILLPESPYWLASIGKFEECATAHRWLKGRDEDSERELETLINSQNENIANKESSTYSTSDCITSFWNTIKCKNFYKPSLISLATISLSGFSGKLLCIVYALDIIKQMTNSESTAYIGMLVLDGVTILSMVIGCIIARFTSRRTFLLLSSFIGTIFLYIMSLYLYLIKLDVIMENKYVSLVLLTAFSIAVGCGPLIMGHSFFCELVPIKSRSLALCLVGFTTKSIDFVFLKTGPLIFRTFGIHGFFLLFGVASSSLVLILYNYLPETGNKTLHEIADCINSTQMKRMQLLGKESNHNK